MKTYQADKNGYYGEFDGAYVPEILHRCVGNLQNTYLRVLENDSFKEEFSQLLRDYVGRPSSLCLVKRLNEKYGYNIYLKREDLNYTGAHKINNTTGRVLLAHHMGRTRVIAETGAERHGVATATVCTLMNMEYIIYIGKTDVECRHANVQKIEMLGTTIVLVTSGDMTLRDATDRVIRDWCYHPSDTYYIIGSAVGPHPCPGMVARLQSVISKEIKRQLLEKEGRDHPDYLITCVGGGNSTAGMVYHFVNDEQMEIVSTETGGKDIHSDMGVATTQLGKEGIVHGARALATRNGDGQIEEPYSVSADLNYPDIGPIHANLSVEYRAQILTIDDDETLEAIFELTCPERIIPALRSVHALGVLVKVNFKPKDVVVLTALGRGDKDVDIHIKYKLRTEN